MADVPQAVAAASVALVVRAALRVVTLAIATIALTGSDEPGWDSLLIVVLAAWGMLHEVDGVVLVLITWAGTGNAAFGQPAARAYFSAHAAPVDVA